MAVNAKKSACLRFGPRYKNACASVMVCGRIGQYFGIGLMDEQISARQSKFYLRYCAKESAVCHAISKLR